MEMPPRNPQDKIPTKDTMISIVFAGTTMGLMAMELLISYFYNPHGANNYEKSHNLLPLSLSYLVNMPPIVAEPMETH
ncbi:MAG: hypothetical protein IPN94_12970 [Sphingobacteriales bacterium]|nr:hypothetical protein [Sphingobacteriales bacterium]